MSDRLVELRVSASSAPRAQGTRRLDRLREREAERQERLSSAQERAAVLLRTVAPLTGYQAMLAIASLLIRHLRVERCDILLFAAEEQAVILGAAFEGTDAGRGDIKAEDGPGDLAAASLVRFDLVHLLDSRAAVDALRVAGTNDRIHVFIHSPRRRTQLGILSLQGVASLNLSANERAFVDAIADAIGAALDRRGLPTGAELARDHARRAQSNPQHTSAE